MPFSHEFLIMLESPSPLLGRDILSKVHASVFMNMEPSLSLALVEQNVNPRVWADGKSVGRAQNAIPVVVKLKDPHLFLLCPMYESLSGKREGLQDNATGKKGKFITDSSQGPLPHPMQWCRSESPEPKLLHKFIR